MRLSLHFRRLDTMRMSHFGTLLGRLIDYIKDTVRDADVKKGETVVLGLRRRHVFYSISEEMYSQQGTIMDFNHRLSGSLDAAKIGQFRWTCVQLTNIHSYMEVDD